MKDDQIRVFQGQKIEILKMALSNLDNQLMLSLEINFENTIYRIIFHNVSGVSMYNMSIPLEVHGFEIINHSQSGWEKNFKYEIYDFEDNRINFFCEDFEIEDNRKDVGSLP